MEGGKHWYHEGKRDENKEHKDEWENELKGGLTADIEGSGSWPVSQMSSSGRPSFYGEKILRVALEEKGLSLDDLTLNTV